MRKSRAELEGVGVVHKREPVFGFLHRIDLFICFICVCVCLSMSFQTGPPAQCPVSTHLSLGSCYHQCGERAPPSGSSSTLGALLPLPAQPTPLSDPSSTAGRCCCRSVTPTGMNETLNRGKKRLEEDRAGECSTEFWTRVQPKWI